MSIVKIRQIPDDFADATGLSKYNRSRMPGCRDRFSPAVNIDGRYLTGIDEDSITTPAEDREKVKAVRLGLEKLTSKDLSGTSAEWEDYSVTIYSDKEKVFNTANSTDLIAFRMLVANGYVAPDRESAYTPTYREAQYYAYTEEAEDQEEMSKRKKRDRALVELFAIEDSKDKLLLYGQYLEGIKYTDKLGQNTLYKMLRAYIEDKDIKNTEKFLAALRLTVEELQQKAIVDKALKQRIINKVKIGAKNFTYQYGQVTVGNTLDEVYKNLVLPQFAPELMAIQKEVNK